MINLLENLCLLNGASGCEESVRKYILSVIKGFAEVKTDALGNLICFKKGKTKPEKKIMVDAHMDEVGIIITAVTPDGFLRFQTVGGINKSILLCRKIVFENGVSGVICCKPIHLVSSSEGENLPSDDLLYVDIGASSRSEAEQLISVGYLGVIDGSFEAQGDCVKSKAIDDRAGCAILIDLIRNESEYDFYATFTVQEEIGSRGAKTAAFAVKPDFCLVLEATTANDIIGVTDDKKVCSIGCGAAISFMDNGTLYDRELYNIALESEIVCQPKCAVAGGNNAGGIHLSRNGVRTLAISVPCRYIHSPSCVANINDIYSARNIAEYMINTLGRSIQ